MCGMWDLGQFDEAVRRDVGSVRQHASISHVGDDQLEAAVARDVGQGKMRNSWLGRILDGDRASRESG